MTQIAYRGNLSSAFFPFVSEYHGRTVIVPGPDNNFNRQLQSSADLDKDIGIPQLYYCHNVLPNGQGIQSVGYEQRIAPIISPPVLPTQVLTVRDDSLGLKAYLALGLMTVYPIQNESIGYLPIITTYWNGSATVTLPNGTYTTAHVNGITYIYIANSVCLKYNFTQNRLDQVTLAGLSLSAIIGLTESNGYLLAYSTSAIAWSSTIDPTDFVPSLQTGAGGGTIEGVKGPVTCASPTSNGFTVFTQTNAISVLYTGNSRYPFQFNECTGSGGVASLERVTYEADSGFNYVYSSKGFQIIQAKSAQTVFAELTDFLAGQYFEDFDESAKVFTYQTLSSPMQKKMVLIAARYLVISYGVTSLTHAIVYDVVQKRFGKLKIPHVDCFEYELLTENVSDIPKKSIAFLQSDGTVQVVNFAIPFVNRSGVAVLGKYQYVRSRKLQLQTFELENITPGGTVSVYDLVSWSGKGYDVTVPGILLFSNKNLATYGFGSPVGTNHSLLLLGCFDVVSLNLTFNSTGRM